MKFQAVAWGCMLAASVAWGQQDNKYQSRFEEFRREDSIGYDRKHQVLLIGSSSFTMWKDVSEYFPGFTILNRGFGGATLEELLEYKDKVIYPYHPRQVFIYCGENDLGKGFSVERVVNDFKQLFQVIRRHDKKVHITYVSVKPSPGRRPVFDKIAAANAAIRDYLSTQQRASFVDVYNAMLRPDGQPMPELFLQDSIHMTRAGYALWQKQLLPYMKK